MHNPVKVWHHEHMRFARLLNFLEMQIASFGAGNHPDYELMRDVLHYLHYFADHYHHPHEGEAFARLLEHAPDLQPMINRLLQEHRVIAVAGEKLLQYLEDILQDNLIERAEIEAAAATYLVYYRHHLDTEEKEVLPRAATMLSSEEWEAIAKKARVAPDPLFGDQIETQYRRLHEQIHRSDSQGRHEANGSGGLDGE